MREHRRERAAVLALQALERVQARLDLLEAPGLALDRLGVAAQLGAQVVGLQPQAAQALGQGIELRVHAGHTVEQPLALGEQRARPALAGIRRQRLGATRGRRAQRVEVAQPAALGLEVAVLAVAQLGRLDLAELPLEQVELAIARAGELAQGFELGLQVPGARQRGREPGAPLRLLGTAEAVEDVELRRGQGQAPVLVLAVEREQGGAHVAQVRRRRGPAAEVGARAPLGADPPRQDDVLRVRGDAVAELLAQRVGQLEDALHVGLRRARPHDPRPGPPAEQQVQRVGEHRLARAGLAREHVEARPESQLGPFDQKEVLDAQLQQHASGVPTAGDGPGPNDRTLAQSP